MILEKRLNGLWWFYDAFYTDSFTPYPFGCIIDRSANTFVLTKENRPSYPKSPLQVAEVQIRVLPSTALETYSTAELLENRLLELGFPPLVDGVTPSSGIPEAPEDGELYGRKDADWEIVSNLDVYSETETVVGTWIDGKPIYQRTFEGTGYFYYDEQSVANILDLGTIVKMYGEIKTGPLYFQRQDSNGIYFERVTETEIYIYNNFYDDDSNYTLTVEYTKTTD
jgi:hypothetical protein